MDLGAVEERSMGIYPGLFEAAAGVDDDGFPVGEQGGVAIEIQQGFAE
jgi:hypothetical protein